jgi:hypothetical protein
MTEKNRKFWIGVASKNHVANGVDLGICQFCHGKQAPAKRLTKGDFVIYYSPKQTMEGSEPYQKFTAIGIVNDDTPYQVTMDENFKPFRRNVTYFDDAQHADIKPLISILPFIKNKQSWGYTFRYGFFEIDQESFETIAQKMLGFNPLSSL